MRDVESGHGSLPGAVDLHFTGDRAAGPHRCAECGYGVCVAELPRCPMCSGETWEPLPAPARNLTLPRGFG